MKLCTYDPGSGRSRAGVVAGEGPSARVVDLGAALGTTIPDVGALLEDRGGDPLPDLLASLAPFADGAKAAYRTGAPLADVRLLAPVLRPPKVTCVGLNYRDHALEQKKEPPGSPLLFAKARTAVTGPRGPVRLGKEQAQVDYEVELCIVIGRPGLRVPSGRALEHVLGYTVACDVSDRDAQYGDKQWYRGKSFPTFCPTGPFVATADALSPARLRLTTELDGRTLQDGTTADLIFDVPTLVSYISSQAPLEAGDLILTGTPAGVGVFRDPKVFLRAGQLLRCAVEGIGALDLAIEAEA